MYKITHFEILLPFLNIVLFFPHFLFAFLSILEIGYIHILSGVLPSHVQSTRLIKGILNALSAFDL